MEDEKGLDLSLGLPCGGNNSSHKDKGKYGSSTHVRADEGDRDSKLVNEFKNFLEGGNQSHQLKIGENFSSNFGNAPVDVEISKNAYAGWFPSDSRSIEIEGKTSSVGEKLKSLISETNQQKKHVRDPDFANKTKLSHISITTDEGSTADNEDVVDSEVDGSTSGHVHRDDVPKQIIPSRGLSGPQESHAFGDSGGVEILGQKRFTISSDKEFNVMNTPISYGVSFPAQPVNMNVSYSQPLKDSNASGTPSLSPSLSSYPMTSVMHAMGTSNGERSGVQPVMPANFQIMYGYSNVQLPVLDRDNSCGIISHHQQIHPTYAGRNSMNADTHNESWKLPQVTSHKSSESIQFDGRAVEHGKFYGKQQVGEEGPSSHAEGDPKAHCAIHQGKDPPDPSRSEPIPSEFPAIRPGIAADLKFGGCGSYPNLPWVSTKSPGPNGRTISGVTYRYSPTQIRIVCACHGSHLSPEEFIRHAGEENHAVEGGGLTSLLGSNPAASAQS